MRINFHLLGSLFGCEFFGDVGVLLELLLPTILLDEFDAEFLANVTDPFEMPLKREESDERGESSKIIRTILVIFKFCICIPTTVSCQYIRVQTIEVGEYGMCCCLFISL